MGGERTFEWDEVKAASNAAKHGVSFQTAMRAFLDPGAVIEIDAGRDYGEERFRVFANVEDAALCVVFTCRADDPDRLGPYGQP